MNEILIYEKVSKELSLNINQISNTIQLLDEGNTVPFIARYRKERTNKLDEDQIRAIQESIEYIGSLEDRREKILLSIDEQGKLMPELKQKILATDKMQELEDLYLPYKPKKRTRAMIAREKGLQPLADMILLQQTTYGDIYTIAQKYVDPDKEVESPENALIGAEDIIAETISENADIRKMIREFTYVMGNIKVSVRKGKDEEKSVYEMYYDYSEPVKKIPSHRILAINRGEKEKILKVNIEIDIDKILVLIENQYIENRDSIFTDNLYNAIKDAYKRLIAPAISREIRNNLTEGAEEKAIKVFGTNLKNLLLQPPVSGKIILGIDPAFRTGCKLAVIDKTGKYLEGTTIFPHPPQNRYDQAKSILAQLVKKHKANAIAIGNGTASRETEQLVAEVISDLQDEQKSSYIIVNEAGASVYSASKIAKEEFPDLEASMRGNISIARRLLDPLAELVKIDPKSIGVGQYQHDVNQKQLNEALSNVIEDCVNKVGVNLNTASAYLLQHISGLTSRTSKNIVKFREENGKFHNRNELKKVTGIGFSAFEQSAGFLRIPDSDNSLDNTSIHPESYDATQKLLKRFKIQDIHSGGKMLGFEIKHKKIKINDLAEELKIGIPTLEDILENLEKPGLDPRDELPKPILKSNILKMEDLHEGLILKGTVRNVVDFGAFVDIGVKQDGLVHISQLANKFVKNPSDFVKAGDIVEVRVLTVDVERQRIGLSMKDIKKK